MERLPFLSRGFMNNASQQPLHTTVGRAQSLTTPSKASYNLAKSTQSMCVKRGVCSSLNIKFFA